MSVENVFNSPEKREKQKELQVLFDRAISSIRKIGIGAEGDAMIKTLVSHYVSRRKSIESDIDENADITYAPKTRQKKQAASEAEPEQAASEATKTTGSKTLTAKNKNKAGDDDLTA